MVGVSFPRIPRERLRLELMTLLYMRRVDLRLLFGRGGMDFVPAGRIRSNIGPVDVELAERPVLAGNSGLMLADLVGHERWYLSRILWRGRAGGNRHGFGGYCGHLRGTGGGHLLTPDGGRSSASTAASSAPSTSAASVVETASASGAGTSATSAATSSSAPYGGRSSASTGCTLRNDVL